MTSFTTGSSTVIGTAYPNYNAISLSSNITLSWSTQFQNGNLIVADFMNVTPTAGGFSITLPDSTETSVGQNIFMANLGAHTFSVLKSGGGALFTLTAGSSILFYLTDNSTAAGVWTLTSNLPGVPVVTSVGASVPGSPDSSNLIITNSPITSSGTINFAFGADLDALISFSSGTGIACRTAADTWALRALTGTTGQIAITNPLGISGPPTIALASTITGVTAITIGNVKVSGNTIEPINTNGSVTVTALGTGDVILAPGGTGNVEVLSSLAIAPSEFAIFNSTSGNGYFAIGAGNMGATVVSLLWPTVAPTAGQVLQYDTGNSLEWADVATAAGASVVNAVAKFINITGSLSSSGVLIDVSNNMTGVTSLETDNLLIEGGGGANTISSTNLNGPITLSPNGTGPINLVNSTVLKAGSSLIFNNAGDTNYMEFMCASTLGTNVALIWPDVPPIAGQVLKYNGANELVWDAHGDIGNFIIGLSPDVNTITTSAGNIILSPFAGSSVVISSSTTVQSGSTILFNNPANTFYTGLKAGINTSNVIFNLPLVDATVANTPLVSDGSANLSFNTYGRIFATSTLATATVAGMYNIPVLLVAAPGAGKAIIVHEIALNYIYNTTAFTGSFNIFPQYTNTTMGGGVQAAVSIASAGLTDQTTNRLSVASGTVAGGATVASIINAGVYLSCSGALTGGGSSSIVVTTWYSIVSMT